MQFENLSDIVMNFSFQQILKGDFEFFIPLLYLIISIAIYSIMIWHFYRFIATRDCFKLKYTRHPKILTACRYFLFYPIIAFLFFAGFSTMMMFLTRDYSISSLLSTSFSIVVAIRLTAYYNDDLSKDVAKMLPFALLGLVLVDPSYFLIEDIIIKVNQLPSFFAQVVQYIIFIVLVEWILRSFLFVKDKIMSRKEFHSVKKEIPTIS